MSHADRLPRYSLEAEGGLLASLLMENGQIPDVAAFLRPDEFYRDDNRRLYEAILAAADAGKPADGVTVSEELTRRGFYREMGGEQFLRDVMDGFGTAQGAPYYAQIVRELATARKLGEAAAAIQANVYAGTMTAEELADDAERRVFAVSEASARTEPTPVRAAVAESVAMLARREAKDRPGLPTGFDDVDVMTDGLHPRKLYILAARPSIGKSALALNVADFAALELARPVLFVSLEMDRVELADRLLMSRGKIDGDRMRFPSRLGEEGRRALDDVVEYVSAYSRLVVDDPPHMTVTQLAARARRHKARHGLGLLVVDYLQLVDGQRSKGDNREQEIANVSRRLKGLAKELNCPVLALCQLNRAAEARDDRRPRLADLRESGQIEQDADCVMLLHRPEYYDPADEPGVAHLIVAKNRGGPTGAVKLRYVKAQTRFEAYSDTVPAAAR